MVFPEAQVSPTAACNDAITAGISGQRNGVDGSSCTAAILSRRCLTWVIRVDSVLCGHTSALPPNSDRTADILDRELRAMNGQLAFLSKPGFAAHAPISLRRLAASKAALSARIRTQGHGRADRDVRRDLSDGAPKHAALATSLVQPRNCSTDGPSV
jgi:hypothetical protein